MKNNSNKYYPNTSTIPDFAKLEEEVLAFWKKDNVFQKSVDNRKSKTSEGKNNEFVFYDGPPFASGLPHYGHLLTGYKKDTIARYQTIKGKRVERRFGWDCHGLPAEMPIEKKLGISGKKDIEKFGVKKFNDLCRADVMKYASEWERYVDRQGRWVDFKNDYKTMDFTFMESTLWVFKQLYDKGLIYEAKRVMPYSWACQTPLSNFETRMDDAYRSRTDKTATVAFQLIEHPHFLDKQYKQVAMLVWTTTPWTLPSNLALAVNPDMKYCCVAVEDNCYIIASSALKSYKHELSDNPNIICKLLGKDLVNLPYQPIFPYFNGHKNAFKILGADFVTEGEGTGVVHIAPGFGEDDHILCQAHDIELVCPVDEAGCFISPIDQYIGRNVLDCNDDIIKELKLSGLLFKVDQYVHNYPHCWRTDTPLIYRAIPSWYVAVTKIKDRILVANQQINWIPAHIKNGLFGKWLENARDWSISRNRFWGTPIPIWISDDPKYPRTDVYGSVKELEQDFGVKITDLHKHVLDELIRPNPDDPTGKAMMRRVPEVFDCWFESGSMPYGQVHYPFENKDWFDTHFPADFIAEYVAQTRAWFYTLLVLSTALFDRPPFLNCVCHGLILDENGRKLSKRLQNYANPLDVFDQYGSDALRWLMLSSSVMRGNDLFIDKECRMVKDVIRLTIKPIWNAYNFFTLYANADGIKAELVDKASDDILDQYILSKLSYAIGAIENHMDNYDTMLVCTVVEEFFEILNNWYIRRSKHRFWKSEKDTDKQQAYNTLYTILHCIMRAISPLLPFLSETIFMGLINNGHFTAEKSVHLQDFPKISHLVSSELVNTIDKIRDICTAAHSIRNTENIRVRQPVSSITVVAEGVKELEPYFDIIKDEVNVKNILIREDVDKFATTKLQLNFKVLGNRIPHKIKELLVAVKNNDWKLENDKIILAGEEIYKDEYEFSFIPNDASSIGLTIMHGLVNMDTKLTAELISEGYVRDIVRLVQQARKDAGYGVSDNILLYLDIDKNLADSIGLHKAYIEAQTLSELFVNFSERSNLDYSKTERVGDFEVTIGTLRV